MIDIKEIRQNPDAIDAALKNRGIEPVSSMLLDMDIHHREIQTKLQQLQQERNTVAKEIGNAKRNGDDATPHMERANSIKEQIPQLEQDETTLKEKMQTILAGLPNTPQPSVPVGEDENDNELIRQVGTPPSFSFEPKAHYDLGEDLGMMDFEIAAKISGARFVVLKKNLARLERALAAFMIDIHTQEYGMTEISPPFLVREDAMYGAGLYPKFMEDAFNTDNGYSLIPTAEVPLTNLVRESIMDAAELPKRFVAFTPCFRSEAGSAGRDTRGMIRQHQFSKVEMVAVTTPEKSEEEHQRMLGAAEEILKRLDIAYRVMLLCTGDMGPQSSKTFDLEVWVPSENTYREISSVSNCWDYQSRRMAARFRATGDTKGKPELVHTLNGSGLAVGRTLIAIIENYQQEDGSVRIPEALVPYMNGATTL